MNCTKHFLGRWTERIVEIKSNKEAIEYIGKNKDMISEHANTTFEHAEFIYKGQIGDNVTRNYYIHDDIVFVTNTTDDAFITVYKVDLGFTKDLNKTVRKGLVEEIKKLTKEKEDVEFKVLQELENKEHESVKLSEEISIIEKQLLNAKKRKEFIDSEVKNIKSKSLNVDLELKKYTMMIVNSKEYRNDLIVLK
jgi:hypothetical protein